MEFVPEDFQNFILKLLKSKDSGIEVLEIGGGMTSRIAYGDARITILDESPDALSLNQTEGRFVEKLVGNAENYEYGPRLFDVAVFWNVLEHVVRPEKALTRACYKLRHDGFVVVRGPELRSLKSIIARNTPHYLHILFYRWVLGIRDAGKNGRSPCRVRHDRNAGRAALTRRLRRMGFSVSYELRYVGDQVTELQRIFPPAHWLYEKAAAFTRWATNGRYGTPETEFILVARRSEPRLRLASRAKAEEAVAA